MKDAILFRLELSRLLHDSPAAAPARLCVCCPYTLSQVQFMRTESWPWEETQREIRLRLGAVEVNPLAVGSFGQLAPKHTIASLLVEKIAGRTTGRHTQTVD